MVIMVCYDGSRTARQVVKLAALHARVWQAEMVVVKAVERSDPLKRAFIEKEEKKLEEEINSLLEEQTVACDCQLFISSTSSGEQLVNFARSEEVDQVFIGVERRSRVGKLVFRSTAQYVILNSPCPVVTVNRAVGS
jgi:nucleotide-binding universal stress UspA family protein